MESATRSREDTVTNEEVIENYYQYCQKTNYTPLNKLAAKAKLENRMLQLFGVAQRHDIKRNGSIHRGFKGIKIMNTTEKEEDIFELLGVARKEMSGSIQTSIKNINHYEELLVTIEKKQVQLEQSADKIKQLIGVLQQLAHAEADVLSILGDPQKLAQPRTVQPVQETKYKPKVKAYTKNIFGINLALQVLSLLDHHGPLNAKSIAKSVGKTQMVINNWLYKTATRNMYVEKEYVNTLDVTYRIAAEGKKLLVEAKLTGTVIEQISLVKEEIPERKVFGLKMVKQLGMGRSTAEEIVNHTAEDLQRVRTWLNNNGHGPCTRARSLGNGQYELTEIGLAELNRINS